MSQPNTSFFGLFGWKWVVAVIILLIVLGCLFWFGFWGGYGYGGYGYGGYDYFY
ncbi:MAG: hypothetical protein ACOYEF_11770 [Planifilum sp.]|jgi:hypothetical protein